MSSGNIVFTSTGASVTTINNDCFMEMKSVSIWGVSQHLALSCQPYAQLVWTETHQATKNLVIFIFSNFANFLDRHGIKITDRGFGIVRYYVQQSQYNYFRACQVPLNSWYLFDLHKKTEKLSHGFVLNMEHLGIGNSALQPLDHR